MITLSVYNTENLFKATTNLFAQLGIKLNSNTEQAFDVKTILNDFYKDREPFTNIGQVYFLGNIDNSVFNNALFNSCSLEEAKEQANKSYYNLMLFAAELLKKPTRTEISEITRAFNRISQKAPVALLLRYEKFISIALSERFLYKQEWRQGEKTGKIIILRDINTEKPHAGHLHILEDLAEHNADNYNKLHDAWLKVLNVQTLNSTFYEKLVAKVNKSTGAIIEEGWYFHCFNDIKIDLSAASRVLSKKIDDELKPQAVIRVIVRMMFIWFMKEKGLIPYKFFKREFANQFLKSEDTYYNAILQNLFFAVVNKKIDERRFSKQNPQNRYHAESNDCGISDMFRYKDFFKDENMANEFVNQTQTIPFMNGGLFQCHDYKFTEKDTVSNERDTTKNYIIDGFSDNKREIAKISDNVIFELIDLFDSYVWTIEESTPTEQDIALDPELLGTVFENLIGFYNPETKDNARKQTGSFYTPREIVDYMCKESLKEALKIKFPILHTQINDLIENSEDQLNFPDKTKMLAVITDLKILDPACGSGAFLMGMFMLMVRTIEKLQEHKTTYKNKLDIITNCIYGVDIQNIAIEISKLRFFISLLVDYQTPEYIEDFEVLPNLETKFVVANTLIGIDLKKSKNPLFEQELLDKCDELTKIFIPFTQAKTPEEKTGIKNAFSRKKQELEILLKENHFGGDDVNKIAEWNPFNVCNCSPFFDSTIMFGLKAGFDVVIGNPPYGADIDDFIKLFETLYPKTSHGFKDIYKYFFDKSISLLNKNGILSFITPNTFLRQPRYGDLRRLLLEKSIIQLVDLGEHIFKAVVPTAISLISMSKNEYVLFADLTKYNNPKSAIQNICFQIIEKKLFEKMPNNLFIGNERKKISNEYLLDDILEMKDAGFKYQRSNVGMREKGNNDLADRIFYIGERQNDNDIPILTGKEINAFYHTLCPEKKLRFNYQDLLKLNEGTYYNKKIMSERIKLIWRQTASYFTGTILKESILFGNTIQAGIIKTEFEEKITYEYLCGLLNSKYLRYLYEQNVKEGGRVFPQVKLEKLKILPIVIAEHQQPIIALVNQILSVKKENPSTDTTKLERKIDKLVYELYGLTDKEIGIVEK